MSYETRYGMKDGQQVAMSESEAAAFMASIPPSKATIVPILTRRQFAQALAFQNKITKAEALSWISLGTLPLPIETAINSMPVADQFPAKMLLIGAVGFERNHPLTSQLAVLLNYTQSQLDALWAAAATL